MNLDKETMDMSEIVKICLCSKYQQQYTTLDEACKRAGVYPYDIENVKKWKYHNIGFPFDAIFSLYLYFKLEEPERWEKANACFIYNQRSNRQR